MEQGVGMATLAVPASAPHVASLRSSHVRRQECRRRTVSVVALPAATTSNCSLASLQDRRGKVDCFSPACAFMAGPKRMVEKLWREFFSDPSQWWDHRAEKVNERYPDFTHKKTKKPLWLNSNLKPPWVEAELMAMAPSAVQLNSFSWNTRLARYVKAGRFEETMELFQQLQQEGMIPDRFTFVQVLNACTHLRSLDDGRHIHRQIMQIGCESDLYVSSSLVDMYAKCGSIEDAQTVFNRMPTHDVVSWNAMILGHVKCGQGHKAIVLFQQMQQEAVEPDAITFMGILNACASVAAIEEGRQVEEQVIQMGLESDFLVRNSLLNMYAKCGSIEDAQRVFNKMPAHDMVAWNSIILGHVKCGQGRKALALYWQMQQEGVEPNPVTFLGILNACASISALEEGRHIHEQITQSGFKSDVFVGNSLIDMYAKCGSLEDAKRVFDSMPTHDVGSWTAMLGGYAMHGQGREALGHFKQMCEEGVPMNNVTFVSLLSACSHAGLVDEGLQNFETMSSIHNVSATVEHYAVMVDLLGRAGRLNEAEDLIKTMPYEPSTSVWKSLLGACQIHGNVEMAERIAKQVLEILEMQSAL